MDYFYLKSILIIGMFVIPLVMLGGITFAIVGKGQRLLWMPTLVLYFCFCNLVNGWITQTLPSLSMMLFLGEIILTAPLAYFFKKLVLFFRQRTL